MAQTKEERDKKKFFKEYKALCEKYGYKIKMQAQIVIDKLDEGETI